VPVTGLPKSATVVAAPLPHFHLSWSFVSGVAFLILNVEPAAAVTRHPVAGAGPQSAIVVHDEDPGNDVVPGSHSRQLACPAELVNVPAGHSLQTFDPGVGAKKPAAQGEHGSKPVGEDEPAGHGVPPGVHDVEPGSDVVPSGQSAHTNAPAMLENVFSGHARHELDPGVGAKKPAAHGEHGAKPLGEKEPAGHGAGVVVVVVVMHESEPGSDVVPGGQV